MEKVASGYNMWNPSTIRKAQDSLIKDGSGVNSEEFMILTYLLKHDCKIAEKKEEREFAKVFAMNNHLFEDVYEEYMKYILVCQDNQRKVRVEPYNSLEVSYEYIMAKLDNFMEELDPKWYDIFASLYNSRRDVIKLSYDSTGTLYLPASDLWLANVKMTDSIEDYANVALVYGEGIAEKLRRDYASSPDEAILIKAFAKTIQYLFMIKLDDFGIQREVTKFFTKDYNDNTKRVNDVWRKYCIDTLVTEPKSAKEVASHIKQVFHKNISVESIEEAYRKSVKKDIQKIIADLILRELLLIYESDQEKFVHDMNALVSSEDSVDKTLKKLNITLNSVYSR